MTMRDLTMRQDIETVLDAFYEKALADDVIGFFFTQVVPLDLKTHVPIIADFWESVIFGTHRYRKNVMEIHQHINTKATIEKGHLQRWVQLFTETVSAHFEGPNAELMKQRAVSIATLMQLKLGGSKLPVVSNIQKL